MDGPTPSFPERDQACPLAAWPSSPESGRAELVMRALKGWRLAAVVNTVGRCCRDDLW